ncbi:MAG: DUF202 domain-containing protein [Streptosporangiaceae bacterium]|jgi:uncharacterized membrane protein YidH (DUF202 family)
MTPADDIEDADPGLARGRTELAWNRTAISFAALGGVILKNRPYAGIPVLLFSVLIWRLGRLTSAPAAGRARARHLLLIAVAVTGVSIAALLITLLGPQSSGFRP